MGVVCVDLIAALEDQPMGVEHHHGVTDVSVHILLAHGGLGESRDADAGGAGPDEDESLARPGIRASAERGENPATTTAAVPWMSSLKLGSRWRYRSSSRIALCCLKSSHCSTTSGNWAMTASTNSSMNASYAGPRNLGLG